MTKVSSLFLKLNFWPNATRRPIGFNDYSRITRDGLTKPSCHLKLISSFNSKLLRLRGTIWRQFCAIILCARDFNDIPLFALLFLIRLLFFCSQTIDDFLYIFYDYGETSLEELFSACLRLSRTRTAFNF